MFVQVSPSGVIFECHPHKSPSGALRHGHLLPACTTSSLIFYTGLSFQDLSPSGVLCYLVITMQAPRLPRLYRGGTDSSHFSGLDQDFFYQGIDEYFFSCRDLQNFKSFLQPFYILMGIHSQTSNKSVSCFIVALAIIGSRDHMVKASPNEPQLYATDRGLMCT